MSVCLPFDCQTPYFKSHHLLLAIVDIGKQKGVHSDRLLRGSRLFYEDLVKGHIDVTYDQLARVIENASTLLPEGEVSFVAGRRLFPNHLNELAPVLLNCESVTALLRVIKTRQSAFFPLIAASYYQNGERCYFLPWQTMSLEKGRVYRFVMETWLGLIISLLKWRFGYIPTLSFSFDFVRPEYVEQYHAHLGVDIHFSQPSMHLAFDKALLNTSLSDANVTVKRHFLGQLSKEKSASLFQQLFIAIQKGEVHSLEEACALFSMSSATMKRKLKTFGCSFSNIHDAVRQQQAVFKIAQLGFKNEQVAQEMSFTDLTNFRRAFKRWTGMTPNDLREFFSL